jgi:hypothetical protein
VVAAPEVDRCWCGGLLRGAHASTVAAPGVTALDRMHVWCTTERGERIGKVCQAGRTIERPRSRGG